jgi:dTDP-4-amino-4,6-dideoxygalactose transaminase
MVADRRRVAALYDEGLRGRRGLRPLAVPTGGFCNFYKYVAVLAEKRDRAALKKELRERFSVSLSGEVYETALHAQPVFEPWATRSLPVAEDLCARHVCLPVFSGMEDADARRVLAALDAVLG